VARRTKHGPSAERYVDEFLRLVIERGTSSAANLREISRRIGCAHTNASNYFSRLDDLKTAAFREALRWYAEAILEGLSDSHTRRAHFRRLVGNFVGFGVSNPGLYRFSGSDPFDPTCLPADVIDTVTRMKAFVIHVVEAVCDGRVGRAKEERIANILLAYLDGEVFNHINGRVLPDEDILARVVDNAELLLSSITGAALPDGKRRRGAPAFPTLELEK
jgi:AcrR family transcriptional regulator